LIAIFTVVPLGKEALSKEVSRVIDLIDKSGVEYRLTAMGTIVEGAPDEVWQLIRQCHEKMGETNDRVSTHITIDDRKDTTGAIRGKVDRIEKHLSKKLKT
jgi:uncharacterized protein (TIGR00106 family)